MRRLTIFYDARCGLCSWARRWLLRQPAFLELGFVPLHTPEADRRLAGVARPDGGDELLVVSDEGGVYRGGDAWIMCLYALEEYREWSLRLARPALRPLARQAFALLSKRRAKISRWLNLASERELAETLRHVEAPACALAPAVPVPWADGTLLDAIAKINARHREEGR